MKKIFNFVFVFALMFMVGVSPLLAATTVTYSGTQTLFDNNDTTSSVIIYKDGDHTATGFVYQCSTSTPSCVGSATDIVRAFNYEYKVAGENSYDWLSSGNASEDCSTNTYAECVTEIDSDAISSGQIDFNFAQLEASNTNGFLATTSFSMANVVTWSGDQLKLILGGGLGLVDALIGWIIAIIIITVIVRLIYHGLRWLHILK